MKEKVIHLDLNKFCLFIKSKETKESIKYNYICKKYNDYIITNKKLGELKEQFFIEKVKEKLEDKTQEWDMDQIEYVNQYYKELKNYKNDINIKINDIKKDIEAINKKVGDKNMEYTKQLEIVKNYKLQLETKIEVKNGYEKVLKRNNPHNSNSIGKNNNNNINNINIGININLNHDINHNDKNIENKEKKVNNIDIINNNNHIYVNNINIFQGNNFDYQINSLNKENIPESNLKKNRKSFSLKKHAKFTILGKASELDKIQMKIQSLDKEIDSINKALIKHYKIMDKEKMKMEKNKTKKENLTKLLKDVISKSEVYQNQLLKNLSEKLKLSEKFVDTNRY
jgi:hypothetical protein